MSPRPMFREFNLLKLYPVVQNGRNVSIPDLGLHKRLRNFHKAEAIFAGLIYGSATESLEHPSLNKKQAIRVTWDHLIENPNHYTCPTGKGHLGGPLVTNPGTYPVMSYGATHRWEKQAAARGVSKVARSGRGFMRAYQRAGSWGKLPESWKRKRNAFVARHMAQVRKNGEQLWKDGNPSRRALALIMWAYMPPKGGMQGIRRSNPPKFVYHGTSSAAAKDIAERGIRMEASTKGYFGEGFYTAEDPALAKSNYADFADEDEGPGAVLKLEVRPGARLLDLRKSSDWDKWGSLKIRGRKATDLLSFDGFAKMMVEAGVDGLYDESFGGWVFYNPKAIRLVGSGATKKNPRIKIYDVDLDVMVAPTNKSRQGVFVFRHKSAGGGARVVQRVGKQIEVLSPYFPGMKGLYEWLGSHGIRITGDWIW